MAKLFLKSMLASGVLLGGISVQAQEAAFCSNSLVSNGSHLSVKPSANNKQEVTVTALLQNKDARNRLIAFRSTSNARFGTFVMRWSSLPHELKPHEQKAFVIGTLLVSEAEMKSLPRTAEIVKESGMFCTFP